MSKKMSSTCAGKFWGLTSFLAAAAACIGAYFPYWLEGRFVMENGDVVSMYFGTFRRCRYPNVLPNGHVEVIDECGRYSTFDDIPSVWWKMSTIVTGIGAGLALLLSVVAVMTLCLRNVVTVEIARALGVLQFIAGMLIGAGVAVYPYGWDNKELKLVCGMKSYPYSLGDCNLYWAFYMTSAAGGLTLLLSLLSCHAYKHVPDRSAPYHV